MEEEAVKKVWRRIIGAAIVKQGDRQVVEEKEEKFMDKVSGIFIGV